MTASELEREWLVALFADHQTDIRWTKERMGDVVQWCVILLGAIIAFSGGKTPLPTWVFVFFILVISVAGVAWLFAFHKFARETRQQVNTIVQKVTTLQPFYQQRTRDPNHVTILIIQAAVVVATGAVAVIMVATKP